MTHRRPPTSRWGRHHHLHRPRARRHHLIWWRQRIRTDRIRVRGTVVARVRVIRGAYARCVDQAPTRTPRYHTRRRVGHTPAIRQNHRVIHIPTATPRATGPASRRARPTYTPTRGGKRVRHRRGRRRRARVVPRDRIGHRLSREHRRHPIRLTQREVGLPVITIAHTDIGHRDPVVNGVRARRRRDDGVTDAPSTVSSFTPVTVTGR